MDRTLALQMARKNGPKIVYRTDNSQVDVIAEWIKWLEYVPKDAKERLEYINKKSVFELTKEDIDYLSIYASHKKMATLFRKYNDRKCNPQEYMAVYDYMGSDINTLMREKLTTNELIKAKNKIIEYSGLSDDELQEKVKREISLDNYVNLSMIDAYVLHKLSIINLVQAEEKVQQDIDSSKKQYSGIINQEHLSIKVKRK